MDPVVLVYFRTTGNCSSPSVFILQYFFFMPSEYISIICTNTCYFWILHLIFGQLSLFKLSMKINPLNNFATSCDYIKRIKGYENETLLKPTFRFYFSEVHVCADVVFFCLTRETFPFVLLSKSVGCFFWFIIF